jgi:hypothetical protein
MKITFGFAMKLYKNYSSLAPHPLKTIKPSPPHPKKNPFGMEKNSTPTYPKHSPNM